MVDDLNSQSGDGHISRNWTAERLGVVVRPFSYSRVGYSYDWFHTWRNLDLHSRRLCDQYLGRQPGKSITPIGVGSGSVVTILGVAHWILGCHTQWFVDAETMRKRVPQVILVAPALCPSHKRLTELFESMNNPITPVGVGYENTALRQLARPADDLGRGMSDKIVASLTAIENAGIRIDVLSWNDDALSPRHCTGDGDVQIETYAACHAGADCIIEGRSGMADLLTRRTALCEPSTAESVRLLLP